MVEYKIRNSVLGDINKILPKCVNLDEQQKIIIDLDKIIKWEWQRYGQSSLIKV